MLKVALLTDSTCDLPQNIIEKHDIKVIPLQIQYKDKEYQDGIDIKPGEIYSFMNQEIPKTSMPSIGYVLEMLKNIKKQGYTDVLSINISGGLSGTSKMMESLKSEAKNIGLNLYVIDSKSISMGIGLLVMKAAELIEKKIALPEIIEKLKDFRKEIKVVFVVKTLEYLRKGGRIGLVEGAIGDILNIKPVISVNEQGIYYSVAKVRGWNRAIKRMITLVKESMGNEKMSLAVLHGAALEEAQKVLDKLKEELNIDNIEQVMTNHVGAGIGVHTGPGVVGITFCPAIKA